MTREKLLRSKEYWLAGVQLGVCNILEQYMKNNNSINIEQTAENFGVSKNLIKQVLNGDFNGRLSTLVELSMACGKIPVLKFVDLDEYIKEDSQHKEFYISELIN